ncbi:MAG: chorismate mutase [bacterium]|nr:chorismate mutase [bacterium]
MALRGIRGAITIDSNSKTDILEGTKLLLSKIIELNEIDKEDIASIFFSATDDLDQAFPAISARNVGLTDTALLCFNELKIAGSLEMCVRILLHLNTEKKQSSIKHVYLRGAKKLRPDLIQQTI